MQLRGKCPKQIKQDSDKTNLYGPEIRAGPPETQRPKLSFGCASSQRTHKDRKWRQTPHFLSAVGVSRAEKVCHSLFSRLKSSDARPVRVCVLSVRAEVSLFCGIGGHLVGKT